MPDNKNKLKLELKLLLADLMSSCFIWVSPELLTQVRNAGEGSKVPGSGFWVKMELTTVGSKGAANIGGQ